MLSVVAVVALQVDRSEDAQPTPRLLSATDVRPIGDPQRIVAPTIGVDATFEPLQIADDGTLEAPRALDDVGWAVAGPEPGEPGAAVVAGHYDTRTGPAVFYRLGDLHAGDPVTVTGQSGSALFTVDRVETHPKDALPPDVYRAGIGSSLRLITCGGDFDRSRGHYLDNVVVYLSISV